MLRRLSKPPFHSDRLNRLGSLFLTLPSRALTGQHVICSLAGSRSKLPRINPAAAEDLGCHALDALTLAAGDRREDHRSEEPRSYLRRQAGMNAAITNAAQPRWRNVGPNTIMSDR